jgi:FG-GAP-like repeat
MNVVYFSNRVLKIVLTLTAISLFSFSSFAISHFSNETNTGSSGDIADMAITNDGRFVAFATNRNFPSITDTNGLYDIYVKDRKNGIVYLASLKNNNTQFTNCQSENPSIGISSNKLRVVFSCSNISANRANIYMREYTVDNNGNTGLTPTTTTVINCNGTITSCQEGTGLPIPGGGNGNGTPNWAFPQISEDGNYVVFESDANLVGSINNSLLDVFRRNLSSGLIELVSAEQTGLSSLRASISSQGRYVVFQSGSGFYGQNTNQQIYRVDMTDSLHTQVLVSAKDNTQFTAGNMASGILLSGMDDVRYAADVSQDGRWVVFQSKATDLTANSPSLGFYTIYLRDILNQRTFFVGNRDANNQSERRDAYPSISNDGRFINFLEYGTPEDKLNGNYIYDREVGTLRKTHYLNANGSNLGADSASQISGNGRFLAIKTSALLDYSPQPLGQDVYVYSFSQLNGGDFNADRITDLAFFRTLPNPNPTPNGTGFWNTWLSPKFNIVGGGSAEPAVNFGYATDIPVSGDFDNDGKTDLAVFRPSTGTWYLQQSTAGFSAQQFGLNGDIPVAADYDGDSKTDIAVFRPSNGVWYLQKSTTGFEAYQFGISTDRPVLGDYDNDGKADIAVWRPSTGIWYVLRACSLNGVCQPVANDTRCSGQNNTNFVIGSLGLSTDIPVQGDYDGDGQTDMAVWRPTTGEWFRQKINGCLATYCDLTTFPLGTSGDRPIPGDYEGDGKTDVAIFRPSTGAWYITKSSDNFSFYVRSFGASGDIPIPAASLPSQ